MQVIIKTEEYDLSLFDIFKQEFSAKYKRKFKNEKLYDSYDRKCHFIIKFLASLYNQSKKNYIKNSINILLEFISVKNPSDNSVHLSQFKNDIFSKYKNELMSFRNTIATLFFKLIVKYEEDNYDDEFEDDPMMPIINDAIDTYLSEKYKFLKGFFELIKYCLNQDDNIYKEFLLILNNDDIFKKIIENQNCCLNYKQKEFLLKTKFELNESFEIIEKLKSIKISNDELLAFLNENKEINSKKKKIKKKKLKQNKNQSDELDRKQNLNFEENLEKNKNNFDSLNTLVEINNNINISNEEKNNDNSRVGNLIIENNLFEIKDENKILEKQSKNFDKEINKNLEELKEKIEECESEIKFIYFKDFVKDIINYSYEYFNNKTNENINLIDKVNFIQKNLNSKDSIIFNENEKSIFSNFIKSSFNIFKENKKNFFHFLENKNSDNKGKYFLNIKEINPKLEDIKKILNKIKYTSADL